MVAIKLGPNVCDRTDQSIDLFPVFVSRALSLSLSFERVEKSINLLSFLVRVFCLSRLLHSVGLIFVFELANETQTEK